MSDSELSPCPFCGGDNLSESWWRGGEVSVKCADCKTEQSKENWNNRPVLDEAVELLRECRDLILEHDLEMHDESAKDLKDRIQNQLEGDSGG